MGIGLAAANALIAAAPVTGVAARNERKERRENFLFIAAQRYHKLGANEHGKGDRDGRLAAKGAPAGPWVRPDYSKRQKQSYIFNVRRRTDPSPGPCGPPSPLGRGR